MRMKRVVQFTGLSGVGKTTLATFASERLATLGYRVTVLDGDELRKTISAELGFSKQDRLEHLRRLAHLATEIEGDIVLVAAINPYEQGRAYFREVCDASLVWISSDLEVLRLRDTKGLYARAFLPEGHPQRLANLTGVNDPYEIPRESDLHIDTGKEALKDAGTKLIQYLKTKIG